MTNKLKCYACGVEFEHELAYHCPAMCTACSAWGLCPKCGGRMECNTGCDDLDAYTYGGCTLCAHECCGDCV
jgi:hypothetical protein